MQTSPAQISFGILLSYPGSRSLMKYAFSANRQVSKYSGILCFLHTVLTVVALAIETGCPPPELFVTVSITSGIFSCPIRVMTSSSAPNIDVALEGQSHRQLFRFRNRQVQGSAPTNSTFARVVSKCVLLGATSPFLPTRLNRMRSAAAPWCLGITCL